VPGAEKRLGELDGLMALDTFWNNRDKAQGLIDEANGLRRKIEPLLKAEHQVEDFRVMVELAEGEPESEQIRHRPIWSVIWPSSARIWTAWN